MRRSRHTCSLITWKLDLTFISSKKTRTYSFNVVYWTGLNALRAGYWHHYNLLPDDVKAKVDAGETHIKIKMRYGGVGILRKDFCDNSAQFEIDFSKEINVNCPVRIIHAIGDADIPYESSMLLMDRLATKDVDVMLKKTGDHRLNTRNDHAAVLSELDRLMKQYPIGAENMASKARL